ncbi:MAG TPA: signal peptidase II [Armatimonadota bacterium]|jgi:signal peptidase II
MKRFAFYILALVVLAFDGLTKSWALSTLAGGRNLSVIPGYVSLSVVYNRGSAFGIVRQGSAALAVIALIAIGFMVYIERRGLPDRLARAAIALQLGGALGNFADRARFGYVIDFIELDWRGKNIWPVFNIADSAITVGTILLIWWLWRSQAAEAREAAKTAR